MDLLLFVLHDIPQCLSQGSSPCGASFFLGKLFVNYYCAALMPGDIHPGL